MKVKIHELAAQELDEAIGWYESQSEGLGKRLEKVLIQQIDKIKQNPTWFLKEENDIYKAYIPKFPYKILFTIDNNVIIIWAIAHMHRKPWYWQNRMK